VTNVTPHDVKGVERSLSQKAAIKELQFRQKRTVVVPNYLLLLIFRDDDFSPKIPCSLWNGHLVVKHASDSPVE
jgi:hypothetical protein